MLISVILRGLRWSLLKNEFPREKVSANRSQQVTEVQQLLGKSLIEVVHG